ncbi:hypothetical protein [Micromonospora radicis]|uniref:Uncharacterized protein n=1 Tax=Micromonospora radicis TaxID=1894971 RepID=A0A418MUY4_9ACTN|nr:hypothetical protein [Micromonospora radicis]RIV38424.1 hypothetical protein D2L64_12850 [Micromonospora radicis]
MSPTTRYLCGAAYSNHDFAEEVIAELVENGRRAVVPAIGYDLGPVLRHCYRARQLWFGQNLIITVILFLGVILAFASTATLLLFALAVVGFSHLLNSPARSNWRIAILIGVILLLVLIAPALLQLVASVAPDSPLLPGDDGPSMTAVIGWAVGLALAVLGTIAATRRTVLRTLTQDLAPERKPADLPSAPADRLLARHRVETVEEAQHGNIVLHSGPDPFLGAGRVTHAWSMALELRRDNAAGQSAERAADDRVAVDPVALNRHVKRCLAALAGTDLPPHERLAGLALRDQIMAAGTRWRKYPLIDQEFRLPYPYATPQAMEAIIRAPQTSARHFLRATVGAENREVVEDKGTTIMPAEYQNIVVSTFTHIAVEGGMLYVENVSTVLGPLRQEFLDIDQYAPGDENGSEPLLQALRTFPGSTLLAPVRLLQAISRAFSVSRAMGRAERDTDSQPVYDFGARAEARQLASAPRPVTYLQRLDAEKYSKLMERRISEAIIGYLRNNGIDTAEYETRMNVFNNNGVFIRGDNQGAAAAGTGAHALLNQNTPNQRKDGQRAGAGAQK